MVKVLLTSLGDGPLAGSSVGVPEEEEAEVSTVGRALLRITDETLWDLDLQ